jgi:hypothetical protein
MKEKPDSEKRIFNGKKCPECKQNSGKLVYTDHIQGNIYTPAADTEVEHHYRCTNPECKHTWTHSA